jgi:outer membrane protein OmpA-like peptidoglycan-associated protein
MARALEFAGDPEGADSLFARWIVPAVVLSLCLHALLYLWAKGVDVRGMSREYYDQFVPRTFQIERVEIDPKLLEPEPEIVSEESLQPTAVALPEERVAFETVVAAPGAEASAPRISTEQLATRAEVPATDFASTAEAARMEGARMAIDDPESLREALLADQPRAEGPDAAEIFLPADFGAGTLAPDRPAVGDSTPGFSNLDDLLARTGPLTPETAPILMPTDLLFDYDSSELRPVAVESLVKLAELIVRNPQSDFLIEGHTDSFGSDEYNLLLSTRRAESVRQWLVDSMNIPSERIETRGLGKSRLIAPAGGTIEEQAINRRVEIVIRAARR